MQVIDISETGYWIVQIRDNEGNNTLQGTTKSGGVYTPRDSSDPLEIQDITFKVTDNEFNLKSFHGNDYEKARKDWHKRTKEVYDQTKNFEMASNMFQIFWSDGEYLTIDKPPTKKKSQKESFIMNKKQLQSLLKDVAGERLSSFEKIFKGALASKLSAALEAKKPEITKKIFGEEKKN